jgi:hypothetical protein
MEPVLDKRTLESEAAWNLDRQYVYIGQPLSNPTGYTPPKKLQNMHTEPEFPTPTAPQPPTVPATEIHNRLRTATDTYRHLRTPKH